jgi:tetratricopeptide (TPR) repeat protein
MMELNMATLPVISADFAAGLKTLLEEADYDGALDLVDCRSVAAEIKRIADYLERLLLICRIADVLDYAGRYEQARLLIGAAGGQARDRLEQFVADNGFTPVTDQDAKERKQEAWAVIHLGMSHYRIHEHKGALECFLLAKNALDILARRSLKYSGSLSRAWYCIGLVHRQENRNRQAKEAFTRSVEHGWHGIEERQQQGRSIKGFDYNLGRNYALGLGWIAYNEASLAEAKSHLVTSRRLLMGSRARFINAYVEVLHACVMMSADLGKDTLDTALVVLQRAYETLTRKSDPDDEKGNSAYAIRCANELAMASLRRALVSDEPSKEQYLRDAKEWLDVVKMSSAGQKDPRSLCKALITESRVAYTRGNYDQALEITDEAFKVGKGIEFSLIDCYITRGEALCGAKNYAGGISDFEQALSLGGLNPKVLAACHLHLAEAHFDKGNRPVAQQYLDKWKESASGAENAFLQRLAGSVSDKIGTFQDFHKPITLDLKKNARRELVAEFRGWLTDVALHNTGGNYKKAADLLNLSPGGLTKIRKAAGLPIHNKRQP